VGGLEISPTASTSINNPSTQNINKKTQAKTQKKNINRYHQMSAHVDNTAHV
jgi:hypothetical protein